MSAVNSTKLRPVLTEPYDPTGFYYFRLFSSNWQLFTEKIPKRLEKLPHSLSTQFYIEIKFLIKQNPNILQISLGLLFTAFIFTVVRRMLYKLIHVCTNYLHNSNFLEVVEQLSHISASISKQLIVTQCNNNKKKTFPKL